MAQTAKTISENQHHEWAENVTRWRWLLDSLECGKCYRDAVYGYDARGFAVRNLVRHKREYPSTVSQPNQEVPSDSYVHATDDDYELRRARTPVPTFLPEVVNTHSSYLFAEEIARDHGSADTSVRDWWKDVDGKGTSIDQWMQDVVSPLLITLGQLDLLFDLPAPPAGAAVETQADVIRYRLDKIIVRHVLPENVVWWVLDDQDQYREVLVAEESESDDRVCRHWRPDGWTLYARGDKVIAQGDYRYGRPPIVRVFDRRRARRRNTGLPRWESIAELQREYYNRDSELILSDTQQAHPILQAPEDLFGTDGSFALGPGYTLPKKRLPTGAYEGWDVVAFPKDAAESIRKNLQAIRDRVDRAAQLTKPAGAQGTTGDTVSQSGVSKRLDQSAGNKLLAQIAAVFERVENTCVDMVLLVAGKPANEHDKLVVYPRKFDLWTPEELVLAVTSYQEAIAAAGTTPEVELALFTNLVRLLLPGLGDESYRLLDQEIEMYLKARKSQLEAQQEADTMSVLVPDESNVIDGNKPIAGPDGGTPATSRDTASQQSSAA